MSWRRAAKKCPHSCTKMMDASTATASSVDAGPSSWKLVPKTPAPPRVASPSFGSQSQSVSVVVVVVVVVVGRARRARSSSSSARAAAVSAIDPSSPFRAAPARPPSRRLAATPPRAIRG
eukprot:31260-Pelagococcus_subviridis.AAC.1